MNNPLTIHSPRQPLISVSTKKDLISSNSTVQKQNVGGLSSAMAWSLFLAHSRCSVEVIPSLYCLERVARCIIMTFELFLSSCVSVEITVPSQVVKGNWKFCFWPPTHLVQILNGFFHHKQEPLQVVIASAISFCGFDTISSVKQKIPKLPPKFTRPFGFA